MDLVNAIDESEMVIGNENAIGTAIVMAVGETVTEIGIVIESETDMAEEMNILERGIMMMTAMRTPVLKEGIKHSILKSNPVSSAHIQLVGIFGCLVYLLDVPSSSQGKVDKLGALAIFSAGNLEVASAPILQLVEVQGLSRLFTQKNSSRSHTPTCSQLEFTIGLNQLSSSAINKSYRQTRIRAQVSWYLSTYPTFSSVVSVSSFAPPSISPYSHFSDIFVLLMG